MRRFFAQLFRSRARREADAFRAESRRRIAELADKGQGHVALTESLRLFGAEAGTRAKLLTVGGKRLNEKPKTDR
jgi:hypothetical protein